jgi:hypothetical protein
MPRGAPQSQTVPSVIILGADAVFAALPATPVQLAHACQRLGYASAFPASWGDELVAGACLSELADRNADPAILCSCPLVRERLLRAGDDLAPWMISLVAPPVAVARYLRSAYGARMLHITYAGSCPGAGDASIDERISPADLLALCRERGVSPAAQPQFFESILPPDRRRSLSMPGGSPSDEALRDRAGGRMLAELSAEDPMAELADRMMSRAQLLVDLAPHVGCACSGIGAAVGGRDERRQLIVLEPPRSRDPVVDLTVDLDLLVPVPRESPPPVPRAAHSVASAEMPPRLRRVASIPTPPFLAALPDLGHAIIREYPHGDAPRRTVIVLRRRGASETPAASLAGVSMPRAYLGKRPRPQPVRRPVRVLPGDGRNSQSDHERPMDRSADLADGPRLRTSPGEGIFSIVADPRDPLPPAPPKRRPGGPIDSGASI